MNFKNFIFKNYDFNQATKKLELEYSFDDSLNFKESYIFDFDFCDYNEELLDRAIQNLFFMAGVSYFKVYPFAKIIVEKGSITKDSALFFSKTYQKGLGEFFYVNKLDPTTPIEFPVNTTNQDVPEKTVYGDKRMIGVGGGKDSLVTIELLKESGLNLATFSLNHRQKLQPLIDRIDLPFYYVDRQWDRKLLEVNNNGGYNGHIPISAIIAATGAVAGILSGNSDTVVSNEYSANEPTLNYRGVSINHQYSKSSEFEKDWQEQLARTTGNNLNYYSALRPYSELAIAKMFASTGFGKYKDVFSSCNAAFTHFSDRLFWDGTCPKCAFVFLALTPFVDKTDLESLFGGKNLLTDPSLDSTYRQLLGIEDSKPLECVGEIKESRSAMKIASQIYPELIQKYIFDLPSDYDYRKLNPHLMPDEIYKIILDKSFGLL